MHECIFIQNQNEIEQTKHKITLVHTVCNEMLVKENVRDTAFLFYLHFPYCSWVVIKYISYSIYATLIFNIFLNSAVMWQNYLFLLT